MSESKIESNSLFKCDVCLNDYGQSRQQKFLPCLHSFCQSCLTVSLKNTNHLCNIQLRSDIVNDIKLGNPTSRWRNQMPNLSPIARRFERCVIVTEQLLRGIEENARSNSRTQTQTSSSSTKGKDSKVRGNARGNAGEIKHRVGK